MGSVSSARAHSTTEELRVLAKSLGQFRPANAMLYSMQVIPVDEFLEMSKVECFEVLNRKGSLCDYVEGMVVIFVSHQWCSKVHNDPHMAQLSVLQQLLINAANGKIVLESDFVSAVLMKTKPESTAKDLQNCRTWHIWYDYFCVPQDTSLSASRTDMQNAILSIPAYIEHCAHFFVLVPSVPSADDPLITLDYETWKARGWCRAERASRALSARGRTQMLLIRDSERVTDLAPYEYIFDSIGHGSFTVDSDRGFCGIFMKTLLENKLKGLLVDWNLHEFRMIICTQTYILDGLLNTNIHAETASYPVLLLPKVEGDVLGQFLNSLGIVDAKTIDEAGFAPLHYAAIAGDVDVMRQILELKVDINGGTTKPDPRFNLPGRGVTPLSLCAMFCGKEKALSFLLESKADCFKKDNVGLSALHLCSVSNMLTSAKMLLDHGMDPTECDSMGGNPLVITSIVGKATIIDKLLEARADINAHCGQGTTALHSAALAAGGNNVTAHLILRMADPNIQVKISPKTPMYLISSFGSVAHKLGQRDILSTYLYHMQGATPLMIAVLYGNFETMRTLLKHGADPSIRNCRGFTASDLAKAVKHSKAVELLT